MSDNPISVVELDNGRRVRATEPLEQIEAWIFQPRRSGLLELTSPDDERYVFVPIARVVLIEAEPSDA